MDVSLPLDARARGAGGALTRPQRRLVHSISLAVLLQWAGAGAILPLLPLYVRGRGGSDAVVGGVMAGYFAAAFVFQYGAGKVSDRLGRLPVLLSGLAAYAAGSLLFLLPGPAVLEVLWRALQGAGAGAAEVAGLAMVTHAIPLSQRGRAVGQIYGAQFGGLAVGPVLGSLAGLAAMNPLFVAAAAASLAAAVPVLMSRPQEAERDGDGDQPAATPVGPAGGPARRHASGRPAVRRAFVGALVAAALIGVTVGVYEVCWTLLLTRRGAAQWEIGLSWTIFALPFGLMSRPAGWLADHLDRRWLAAGSLGWTLCFCAAYPFLPSVLLLLILGAGEAVGAAVSLPACQSLLGEGTGRDDHGRAQGLFASSQTATTALAAAAAGTLFALAPWAPFVGGAAVGGALLALTMLVWRRVPGHVARSGARAPAPAAGPGTGPG